MPYDGDKVTRFLTSKRGPVWAAVAHRAEGIQERAYENVSGRFLNVDTGRLRDGYGGNKGLHTEIKVVNGEVEARVGSDAVDPRSGESYPGFWNAGLRPWLETALRDEFTFGRSL